MEKTDFWNDAAKYGALLGAVLIGFSLLGMYLMSGWVTFASYAAFAAMLYLFTRRRTILYGANGYSYGQCLKYIFWMMVFAGILVGAYEIVARNVLFPELYTRQLEASLGALTQTGLYNGAQQEMMASMARSMVFSPIWIVVTTVLGWVFFGMIAGLVVAAFTKRDPNPFADGNEQ